jgi:hypothetical protein
METSNSKTLPRLSTRSLEARERKAKAKGEPVPLDVAAGLMAEGFIVEGNDD